MELNFVSPELGELDALECELLACAVWQELRPPGGLAGLCDWRMAGGISRRMRVGELTGACDEVVLVPGRPRLTFDKLLLFGAGPREDFDEARFRAVTHHMLAVIDGLGAHEAVVELPGRAGEHIRPERAADMLLEAVAHDESRRGDVWTLVESGEARKRIQQQMVEERRRIRYDP